MFYCRLVIFVSCYTKTLPLCYFFYLWNIIFCSFYFYKKSEFEIFGAVHLSVYYLSVWNKYRKWIFEIILFVKYKKCINKKYFEQVFGRIFKPHGLLKVIIQSCESAIKSTRIKYVVNFLVIVVHFCYATWTLKPNFKLYKPPKILTEAWWRG